MPEYRNIVFGTDFSKNAEQAFQEARYMASVTGAHLYVVHVVPGAGGSAETGSDKPLGELRDAYQAQGAEYAILRGNETEQILRFADERQAGLIVIGARGIGMFAGLFGGGSIADKIVKNSKIPVLVVPAS
jgi:nucleotide-binding universal stress UspA family protein